jgi:molybdopterin-guanine dinucleotide biosynthesis protein MobB
VIFSFCAPSGTGKTTFLLKLIPLLQDEGFSVALLKSTHHHTLSSEKHKDSSQYELLGIPSLITVNRRKALHFISSQTTDFVLIEGGRRYPYPTLLLKRGSQDPSWSPPLELVREVDLTHPNALLQTKEWLVAQHLLAFK